MAAVDRPGIRVVPDPDGMRSVVARLAGARDELADLVAMVEEGRACEDVVTRLAEVSRAVDRAGFAVITLGLRQCAVDPGAGPLDVAALERLFLSLA